MTNRTVTKALILAAALTGPPTACGITESDEGVILRVENHGTVGFDQLTLFTPDGPRVFIEIGASERTPWFSVSRAYPTATTEVVVGSDTLRLQVIDHVGEPELDPGRYTFLIRVVYEGSQGRLEQTLRRD